MATGPKTLSTKAATGSTGSPASNHDTKVRIDAELYQQYLAYNQLTGIPITRVINNALKDWAETTLAARMEAFQTMSAPRPANVVTMPPVPTPEHEEALAAAGFAAH